MPRYPVNLPFAIFAADTEGRVRYRLPLVSYTNLFTSEAKTIWISPQVKALTGYTPTEWIDTPGFFESILHPDDRDSVLEEVRLSRTELRPFSRDYRLIARSGETIWVHDDSVPVLDKHGCPEFIQGYDYARSMPWLADVARIERAWLDAYHAADAEPLAPLALASIHPERLAATILTPHPATRVLRSRFPAVSIFAANRGDGPVGRIEATGPEDALVTRPYLDVIVRHLPPGGAVFMTRLIAGDRLGQAAASAVAESPEFDLAANIAGMLDSGAFSACHEGPDDGC